MPFIRSSQFLLTILLCAWPVVAQTAGVHSGGLGATEEQMSTRGALPQRIDKHGTKVEELAGTGTHDAQGG